MIAKNMLSAAILSSDMSARRIQREYLAVCEGAFSEKEGTVDMPIGRVPESVILRKVDTVCGKRAVTHYKVLAESQGLSLVRLKLDTGRCHQIRVHMSYIGHPLPGDYLYHPDYTYISRVPLHAFSLSFSHPVTSEKVHLSVPLPDDMQALFPSFSSVFLNLPTLFHLPLRPLVDRL